MKLPRPYIPLRVRVEVALRQLRLKSGLRREHSENLLERQDGERDGAYLRSLLELLALTLGVEGQRLELHHRPALLNRKRSVKRGETVYDPPANDPEHLVYLPEHDHDIETRVRGVGAQRSDLAEARHRKRIERNKAKRARPKTRSRFIFSAKKSKPKRKWPKRSFPKRRKTRC